MDLPRQNRKPWTRPAALAIAVAAAAVCGCCSSGYGPSPYGPYGGGVPPYYNQPGGFAPQPQPYGGQIAPQPLPGTLPGGTNLGPPSGGVPPLSAPGGGYDFPGGEFDDGFNDGFDDVDDLDAPTYNGGFGTTPTGGTGGASGAPDSGGPYYEERSGFGTTPTGGGDLPPAVDEYSPDAFDLDESPDPNGVDLFEPPPPGTTPNGFQDPLPDDFGSTGPRGRRPGPAARLPYAPARPLLNAAAASSQAAGQVAGQGAGPRRDRAVRPAGAVQPAGVDQTAGPARTVTGVVDHDAATNVWTLTYTMHPDAGDRFGGVLTLIDNGHLAGLEGEQNLIVSVDGRIDPAAGPDALGKPRFRVDSATEKGYYEGR